MAQVTRVTVTVKYEMEYDGKETEDDMDINDGIGANQAPMRQSGANQTSRRQSRANANRAPINGANQAPIRRRRQSGANQHCKD